MKKWPLVLMIIILFLLIVGLLIYTFFSAPSKPKKGTEIENPTQGLSEEQAVLQFDEDYISFVVFAIGGWKLRNPVVKVIIDSEVFVSEMVDGEITTEKRTIENEDIVLRTTKQGIVEAIFSPDIKEYMKNSIKQGNTELELKASYRTLFTKRYLSVYEDLTGEKFTGSVVKIFNR